MTDLDTLMKFIRGEQQIANILGNTEAADLFGEVHERLRELNG